MRSRLHSFHPTDKTVADLCFDCVCNHLSDNQTPLWRTKLMFDKLLTLIKSNPAGVCKIFAGEKKSWVNHFIDAVLGKGLQSVSSVKEISLKVTADLAKLDHGALHIRSSIAKWITSYSRQADTSVVLSLLSVLMFDGNQLVYLQQYGDVAVSNIMKGLQQPDVIPQAVSCLSKLLDVYDVSQGHAKVLLSQLISLVEDKTDHQHRVAELILKIAVKHQPESTKWLTSFAGLEMIMKKIILSGNMSVSRYLCDAMSLILSSRPSLKFSTALTRADMYDVLCDSLNTNDRQYLVSAVTCIHAICVNKHSQPMARYGLDTLLRCCHHFVNIRADGVLSQALNVISLLMARIEKPHLELANKTEVLLLSLSKHVIADLSLDDTVLLESIRLILQLLDTKPPGAGCTQILIDITQAMIIKMSMLPMQEIVHTQQLFLVFVQLCDKSARYITHCNTVDHSLNTPEQRRELCITIIKAVDDVLLTLFETMLSAKDVCSQVPQSMYQLFNSMLDIDNEVVRQFLEKFLKSGGLLISLDLKHWDRGHQYQPINEFIAHVVAGVYHQRGEACLISPKTISRIPDDIHSLISEIFQPLDKESMCSCVDILCALCMTDASFVVSVGRVILRAASGRYDADMVRKLGFSHQLRLARLIAGCVYALEKESDSATFQLPSFKQGLSPLLVDYMRRRLSPSCRLPPDISLLCWLTNISDSDSHMVDNVLRECCMEYCKNPQKTELIDCLVRQPQLLDSFMLLVLARKLDTDTVTVVLDSIKGTIQNMEVGSQVAVYNILEIRLCELCLQNPDIISDQQTVYYLNQLVSVLQAGSKRRIDNILVRVLQTVLRSLHTDKLCSQTGILAQNFIVTMIYHCISVQDSSVAMMIVNSEELRDYINFYLTSRDEGVVLSTINTLSALYTCVIKYKISVVKPFKLSPHLLINALNSSKPFTRVAFLQLWSAHLCCLTLDIRTNFVRWEEPNSVSDTVTSVHGLSGDQIRTVYFYLLQDLLSNLQPVKSSALMTIQCMNGFLRKFSPPLDQLILEHPWKRIADDLSNSCGHSKSQDSAPPCDSLSGNYTPFLYPFNLDRIHHYKLLQLSP